MLNIVITLRRVGVWLDLDRLECGCHEVTLDDRVLDPTRDCEIGSRLPLHVLRTQTNQGHYFG